LRPSQLRLGAALALLGFLIFFFVPIVYDPRLFACAGWGGCLTNAAGLKSLGYWLFNWGGAYSFASGLGNSGQPGGYFAPPIGDLSTYGVLLYAAFPLVAAFIGLLAPEIMGMSRAARIGFIVFGGFVLVFSAFLLVSTMPAIASLGPGVGWTCLGLIWEGGAMAFYGLQATRNRPSRTAAVS
jgi:hypothetical protein